MPDKRRILIVDDDADMRTALELTFRKAGYECSLARDGGNALEKLGEKPFDIMVTDLRMPRIDGLELIERTAAAAPNMPSLVITAHGTVDTAVESMKRGAVDFVQKPFSPEIILAKASSVLAKAGGRPSKTPSSRHWLITEDPAMEPVLSLIEGASATKATVLISGESGVGKEVAARRIHEISPWADQPYVALNCAAIPGNLMESELFGCEKGAYTGASEARRGKFELAQRGTILLDEVSEMDTALQAKLLRVLQEREVERVGGSKAIPLDVRVIATTNRDLPDEVRKGRFREDLYYRLHVIPIYIPPLRSRPKDIEPLARHFVKQAARTFGKKELFLSKAAVDKLCGYGWPGNARELQNVIDRAAVMAGKSEEIKPSHLIFADGPGSLGAKGLELDGTLEEMEKELILAAFDKNGRNKKATARALGINIKTLRARLKDYGIGAGDDEAETEA